MAMIDLYGDSGGGDSYDPQMGGRITYTDPPVRDNPAPGGTSGSVGAGIPWNSGASQPSANPAGYTWDTNLANYVPTQTQTAGTSNHGRVDAALAGARSSDDANYWYGKIDGDPNGYGSAWGYWLDRINRGDGAQLGLPRFQDGPAAGSVPSGGSYSSTNPFSDPATKNYIDLLNSRISQLLTPQQNPDMGPLLDYMRKYFAQLQNPVYTDAQRDLIQTQQLDPMERQRQQRKQQIIQQLASRGMSPTDGPGISALADIDRQFDTMRSSAQGGAAVNEINLGRQNQQQAVDVGSAIASLQNGMFQQQDQRANQAVGYAKGIPDLAQQRMAQSIQLLNGNQVNPSSLLSSLGQFQNQGMYQNGQDSQFYTQLFGALAKIFGL